MTASGPVAITGASGFLGQALIRAASRQRLRVRGLSRQLRPDSAGVEWLVGDVRDEAAVGRLVAGASVLIHAAATMRGDERDIHDSILGGTTAAAHAALDGGVRLVHISSLAVIDPAMTSQPGAIRDDSPLDPTPFDRGGYSRSKIEAECLIEQQRRHGLDAVIVRPAQLVGDGLGKVPPSIGVEVAALRIGLVRMEVPLAVVHVDDAADAIIAVATADTAPEVMNLVDPVLVSRAALLHRLRGSDVPGSRLPLLPLGPVVQPLARVGTRILPGAAGGVAYRLMTMESMATWNCRAAATLGWRPKRLQRWLGQIDAGGDHCLTMP